MFLEIMSELRSPVSRAMQWCGWEVLQPIDIIFGWVTPSSYSMSKASRKKANKSSAVPIQPTSLPSLLVNE